MKTPLGVSELLRVHFPSGPAVRLAHLLRAEGRWTRAPGPTFDLWPVTSPGSTPSHGAGWLEFVRGQEADLASLAPDGPLPPGGLGVHGVSFEQLRSLVALLRSGAPEWSVGPLACPRSPLACRLPAQLASDLAALSETAIPEVAKRWSVLPVARERRQRPLRDLLEGLAHLGQTALEKRQALFVLVREP